MIRGKSFKLFVISTIMTQRETVIRIEPPRKEAAPRRAYLEQYFHLVNQYFTLTENDGENIYILTVLFIEKRHVESMIVLGRTNL